jgi:hypothetical protein
MDSATTLMPSHTTLKALLLEHNADPTIQHYNPDISMTRLPHNLAEDNGFVQVAKTLSAACDQMLLERDQVRIGVCYRQQCLALSRNQRRFKLTQQCDRP